MSEATPEERAAGRGYESLFVPSLFTHWTDHVISAAKVAPGQDVLDVACGTGVLTRAVNAAIAPTGRVVGLDPAPGMLATAAEQAPNIEWVSGVAEDLPFPEASFDRVLSQFGMMFFSDRTKSASEMRRVLRPGGRVALAVWDTIDANPAYRVVVDILDERIGTSAGDATRMPFNLGDAQKVADILIDAGFTNIQRRTITGETGFPSARTMVEAEIRGWLPLFGIHLEEDQIDGVLAVAEDRLAQFKADDGTLAAPLSAHIISAG